MSRPVDRQVSATKVKNKIRTRFRIDTSMN
jgi:hypothetical protein